MMISPDTAGIIKFLMEKTGIQKAYYTSMPQDFEVPSIYFPEPSVRNKGDTLLTYGVRYTWYVKVFAASSTEAFNHALTAVSALSAAHRTIPVIDVDGNENGSYIRTSDPTAKIIGDGVAELELSWLMPKPYDSTVEAMGESAVGSFSPECFVNDESSKEE